MTSLKTSIKTITYLSDIGCLEIQGASLEFHENRAKAPFIGLVQLWQAVRRWRRQMQTRRVLQQMSDERLRDIGLRREDVE